MRQALAREEQLARLRQGVNVWNEWRSNRPDEVINLKQADLRDADLEGADLARTNLNGADLTRANLRRANLSEAKLVNSKLMEANFVEANFCEARLMEADLHDADLTRANLITSSLGSAKLFRTKLAWADLKEAFLGKTVFSETNLEGANLLRAKLNETFFSNVDLSLTGGLDRCDHYGPSCIDHRTLVKSKSCPLDFWRGCGLPDRLIDYLPSLTDDAVHFYTCFISHSTKDLEFAERLHADLQDNGVRCWFSPQDMEIGGDIWDDIDSAIRTRDKIVLILSENALSSGWIEDEVKKGFAEERSRNQRVLFPVRIDDAVMDSGKPWITKLRDNRNIGDFTKWKEHDAYKATFERVLRDLKAKP